MLGWFGQRRFAARLLSAAFFATAYGLLGLVFIISIVPRLSDVDVRRVVSGSMEPDIELNALSITRPVNPARIDVGDVILFDAPGSNSAFATPRASTGHPVLHRVTRVVQDDSGLGFETKGDNNDQTDAWVVPARNVRGELLFHVPYVGYLVAFLATQLGYFLCVVLPGFAIMIPELVFILRWILRGEPAETPPALGTEAAS